MLGRVVEEIHSFVSFTVAVVADAWFPPAAGCHPYDYVPFLRGQRCLVRWELNWRLSEGA